MSGRGRERRSCPLGFQISGSVSRGGSRSCGGRAAKVAPDVAALDPDGVASVSPMLHDCPSVLSKIQPVVTSSAQPSHRETTAHVGTYRHPVGSNLRQQTLD